MKGVLFVVTCLLFSGCVTNNLDRYYMSFECGDTIPCEGEPMIERRNGDAKADIYKMLDDDYAAIGVCAFEGGEFDGYENQIRRMAKERKVEKVLAYSRYDRTESGATGIPLTTYNTSTVMTPTPFGGYTTSFVTTPSTMVMPVSYSNRRFNYDIVFYRKIPNPPKLGLLFEELTEEEAKSVASRECIKVLYVIRNKAAWKSSNLFKGDIILEVNGQRPTVELIRKAADTGEVSFKIFRDGKQLIVTVRST